MNIAQLYHDRILGIGDGTGLFDTILHIHARIAMLLLVCVATSRALATLIPFIAVVMAELANELMNYLIYDMRWADTLSNIVNTLA